MTSVSTAPQGVPCTSHPDVLTLLRCSKCERPICPRCLVQTPVGARCRECAQLRRLPTFEVRPALYLRGAGVGLVAAILAGMVWSAIPLRGFLSFIIAPLAGYAIGEAVSWAADRRISAGLKVLAVAAAVVAFLVSLLGSYETVLAFTLLLQGNVEPLAQFFAFTVARALLNPFSWIMIALAGFMAVRRIDRL